MITQGVVSRSGNIPSGCYPETGIAADLLPRTRNFEHANGSANSLRCGGGAIVYVKNEQQMDEFKSILEEVRK